MSDIRYVNFSMEQFREWRRLKFLKVVQSQNSSRFDYGGSDEVADRDSGKALATAVQNVMEGWDKANQEYDARKRG